MRNIIFKLSYMFADLLSIILLKRLPTILAIRFFFDSSGHIYINIRINIK